MELLIYLLKVSACTVLFFGFYLLVLKELTFFKINRMYLLATLLLSFVIPALQFEVEREIISVETKVPINIPEFKPISQEPTQLIQPVTVEYETQTPKIDWVSLILYAYGGIASLLLVIGVWRLFTLLKYTKHYTKSSDGLKLIPKTGGFNNCSFFNYVFIDENRLSENELQVLLTHEGVHASQYHSVDKILLMLCKAVLWFNPVVYLFDKAIEQNHEYEADDVTSSNFGHQAYAKLLLKLAVRKSDSPLIHNFVKSPIKNRIKMLFNSKSTRMKKLVYLLALPVVFGMVWLFAVEVVYAQKEQVKNKGSKVQQDFYEGTLKGKVLKMEKGVIGYTFNFLSQNRTYSIVAFDFKDKIKAGDAIIAYIDGRMDSFKKLDKNGKVIYELKTPVYLAAKITTLNGKLIYERKIPTSAFLYEANKARSATSKIKSIQKNVNGSLNKIVLFDGTFTINLNLSAQNLRNNNFKIGDKVLVKFIGEKLVSKNTYSTDKMIVLYSEPRKYELKNETLYNKFYQPNGKQKVAGKKQDSATLIKPKVISYSKTKGDIKNRITYMEDAVIEIDGEILSAKKVEWNKMNNTILAKGASLEKNGIVKKGDKITFDLNRNTHFIFQPTELKLQSENTLTKVEYKAKDSVKFSRDKTIIHLFGSAELKYGKTKLLGSKIIYNQKTNSAKAYNAEFFDTKDSSINADSIYFDFTASKARLFGVNTN